MANSKLNLEFDFFPFRLSGMVYGALLNHQSLIDALSEEAKEPPYKGLPKAPVLYVKPSNTHALSGDKVVLQKKNQQVEIGGTLGIVIGRTASHLTLANALDYVAGYTIVNDMSVAHSNFYRPSIPLKAVDGFCPIGPRVVSKADIQDPDKLNLSVYIDGNLVQTSNTGNRLRNVAQLLVDVSDFMTLNPGDILTIGVSTGAPLAHAGQEVRVEIEGIGNLTNRLIEQGVSI